jgi:hypothetical protein
MVDRLVSVIVRLLGEVGLHDYTVLRPTRWRKGQAVVDPGARVHVRFFSDEDQTGQAG